MRFINTTTFRLENGFYQPSLPRYAVLSHTWSTAPSPSSAEVSLRDLRNVESAKLKPGWSKIYHLCRLARAAGIHWAWVDTCCVDRSSLAEVQEAANGALRLFEGADICYVYLADLEASSTYISSSSGGRSSSRNRSSSKTRSSSNTRTTTTTTTTATPPTEEDLRACRWFWRSWTLVELVAAANVQFHDHSWAACGTKDSLRAALAAVTGVDEYLLRPRPRGQLRAHLAVYTVAERMSWAARRQTTVPEDVAYALMGLFDVSMPLQYGEGPEKAFARLQQAIAEDTNDLTLLAWRADPAAPGRQGSADSGRMAGGGEGEDEGVATTGGDGEMMLTERGVLARHPSEFASAHMSTRRDPRFNPEFVLTNKGLRMETRLYRAPSGDIVLRLNCGMRALGKPGSGGSGGGGGFGAAGRTTPNGVAEIISIGTPATATVIATSNGGKNRSSSTSKSPGVLGKIQEHQAQRRGMPYSHLRVMTDGGQRSASPSFPPTPVTPYGSGSGSTNASHVSLVPRPSTTPNSIPSHSPLSTPMLHHQLSQPQLLSTTWASGAGGAIADVGIYLRSHGGGVYTRARPTELASIEGWPVVDIEKATIYIARKVPSVRFGAAASPQSANPPSHSPTRRAPTPSFATTTALRAASPIPPPSRAPTPSFSTTLQLTATTTFIPPGPTSPPLPPLPAEAWESGDVPVPADLHSFIWKGDLGLPRYFSHVRAQPEMLWDGAKQRFVTAGVFGPSWSMSLPSRTGTLNNNNNSSSSTTFTACHLFQCEPDVQPRSFVVAYGLTRWGDRDTAWACVLCEKKAPDVLAAAERGDLDAVGRLGCQAGERTLMLKRERDFFPRTVSLMMGCETIRQVPVFLVRLKVDRWVE